MTIERAREVVAKHPDEVVRQGVRKVLEAVGPLYPQLDFAVPVWTNGIDAVQSHVSPGAGWFRIAINVKEAA